MLFFIDASQKDQEIENDTMGMIKETMLQGKDPREKTGEDQ